MHIKQGLLGTLMAVSLPITAQAQTGCPVDDPRSRAMVERFITRPEFQPDRIGMGLPVTMTTSNIRVLTTSADSATCQRIASSVSTQGNLPWTAYAVGGRYFVAYRKVPADGSYRLGFTPFVALNADLSIYNVLAM